MNNKVWTFEEVQFDGKTIVEIPLTWEEYQAWLRGIFLPMSKRGINIKRLDQLAI